MTIQLRCATIILLLASLITVTLYNHVAYAGTESLQKSFVVFDGTLYKKKPNLSKYGIRRANILYASTLWPDWHTNGHTTEFPTRTTILKLANQAKNKGEITILDIEHWQVKGRPEIVGKSVNQYSLLAKMFHEVQPELQLGYYGLVPIRDYHRAIKNIKSDEFMAWKNENDKLSSIAMNVDILFPSIYTFYPDQQGWLAYAIAQIQEARRFKKPVYVFLWPQFHDSNRLLRGKYIPPEFWKLQLETAYKYADGIVIWGGWGETGPMEWDEDAPWWLVTKEFMKQL